MLYTFFILLGGILFFVGLGMSYRTWRWHTLAMVLLVFAAAVTFIALAVQTLKVHQAWGEAEKLFKAKVAEVKQQNKDLTEGFVDNDGKHKDGIKQLRQRVVDATRDRARMWTGCTHSEPDPATGEVRVTVNAPKEHQIKGKMLLYVFDERPAGGGGKYLGSFRVTAVTGGEVPAEEPMAEPKAEAEKKEDMAKEEGKAGEKDAGKTDAEKADAGKAKEPEKPPAAEPRPPAGDGQSGAIVLTPNWAPLPDEMARIKESSGPWTLYEKLPVDDHETLINIHLDPLTKSVRVDEGKPLEHQAEIKRLLPEVVAEEYVRDFQAATWNNKPGKSDQATEEDPPQRQAVLVRFEKNHLLPALPTAIPPPAAAPAAAPEGAPAGVDGGAPAGGGFAGGAPAGGAGANAAPVGGGNPGGGPPPAPAEVIEYKSGTQAWLPLPIAIELREQQIVTFVTPEQRRYVRPLRDYTKLFDRLHMERARVAGETERVERRIIGARADQEGSLEMIKKDEARLANLQHDLERLEFEKQALIKFDDALRRQQKALLAQWRDLFLANQRLAEQIDRLQREAAAKIDKRAPAPPQAAITAPGEAVR